MMTDEEFQKWEEQHKKDIKKKKRMRKLMESDIKLKTQAAVESQQMSVVEITSDEINVKAVKAE